MDFPSHKPTKSQKRLLFFSVNAVNYHPTRNCDKIVTFDERFFSYHCVASENDISPICKIA